MVLFSNLTLSLVGENYCRATRYSFQLASQVLWMKVSMCLTRRGSKHQSAKIWVAGLSSERFVRQRHLDRIVNPFVMEIKESVTLRIMCAVQSLLSDPWRS
jgi:hypothetical protein